MRRVKTMEDAEGEAEGRCGGWRQRKIQRVKTMEDSEGEDEGRYGGWRRRKIQRVKTKEDEEGKDEGRYGGSTTDEGIELSPNGRGTNSTKWGIILSSAVSDVKHLAIMRHILLCETFGC